MQNEYSSTMIIPDSGSPKDSEETLENSGTLQQALEARPYRPGQKTKLFDLPLEILQIVFKWLVVDDFVQELPRRIQITCSGSKAGLAGGLRHPRLLSQFKWMIKHDGRLTNIITHIFRTNVQFFSQNICKIGYLGNSLSRSSLAFIIKLELMLDDSTADVQFRDRNWTQSLRDITGLLKKLEQLSIVCPGGGSYEPYVIDHPTSFPQILQLMAFLVLRHPRLNRLILPANNDYRPMMPAPAQLLLEHVRRSKNDDIAPRPWLSREVWAGSDMKSLVTIYDEVLCSTRIRRTPFSELCATNIYEFVMSPEAGKSRDEITSSEVAETHDHYRLYDERAYRTKEYHQVHGWRYRRADYLFRICQRIENEGVENVAVAQKALAENRETKKQWLKQMKPERRRRAAEKKRKEKEQAEAWNQPGAW